ncbi:hypothetical protein [Streptomyces sp. NPDC056524]|uniref:hypothetical protein n=1 Tax=Streptomyces sp. NPDC056524 TaxID=3345851 RepID=UPI0036BFD14E
MISSLLEDGVETLIRSPAGELELIERRLRRLDQLKNERSVDLSTRTLERVWEAGRRPERITLRRGLLLSNPQDPPPPLTQLLRPRGVALRFYLLAVFEAQCRLGVGDEWTRKGSPRLKGPNSWSDFVAIDGAYDKPSNTYMPITTGDRDLQTLRRQQIHGALRTLESLGSDNERALVEVPERARGGRDYADFRLMQETGRGGAQTPALYSIPANTRNATFTVPVEFFLHGWIQVLQPAEVATWMILRWLAQTYPGKHSQTGVYLYAKHRTGWFRLRRDSYEDACNRLLSFGLIQNARADFANSSGSGPSRKLGSQDEADAFLMTFSQPARTDVHEPNRYQVTNNGLAEDAVTTCNRELLLRQHQLRMRQD